MIKDFLKKITKKQEEKKEIFLALEIDNEKITSCVWQVKQGKTEVLKLGSLEEWQEGEKESLLLASDASVSKVLEGISQEPAGVIFGLPEFWVKNEEILPSSKQRLRIICEKLTLKPLGFVVTAEALIQYLKKEEGVPLSAILVKLEELEVVVSLVKLGKIKGLQRVGRSEDLGADVEEALARFEEKGVLPARILLFNGLVDFEEARQQLISFSWENLNFLHLPKVEILEPRISIKAIAIAGGTEVAKSLGFQLKPEAEETTEKPEDLGFVEGEEGLEKKKSKAEIGREPEIKIKRDKRKIVNLPSGFIASIIGSMKSFKPLRFFKRLTLFLPIRSRLPLFLGITTVFLASFFFFTWWFWQKAEITLYLQPKIIKETLALKLDPEATEQEAGVLKTAREKVSVEGKKQKEASGKKLVGEKAKGEVMIYNKTDGEKTFPEETVLIGPEGLTFMLAEEIKIASQSAEEAGVTYGKATVKVEAASIGTEGNLEGEAKLSLKGFSQDEFSAKTEAGFSGGTSREIRAVSAEDREELKEKLMLELKEKAEGKLKGEIEANKEVLQESQEEKIIKEQFSHEEGEETTDFSLELALEVSLLTFSQDDLFVQAKEQLKGQISEDFEVVPEGIRTEIISGDFSESKGNVELKFELKLQPKIKFDELRKELKGKRMQEAEQILGETPGYSKSEVKISRFFPGLLARVPYREKNIKIEIKIL